MSTVHCGGWEDPPPRGRNDQEGIGLNDRRSHSPLAGSFVRRQLATTSTRPIVSWKNWADEVIWFNLLVVCLTPAFSLYGLLTTRYDLRTAWFSAAYYVFNMLGITAGKQLDASFSCYYDLNWKWSHAPGYHRLWSHRAYNACKPLQYLLAIAGAGAVQGSIKWWCRNHRSHHRYTDTDLDPYGAHRGLWWSHIGWMLTKPHIRPGPVDTSDLKQNGVVDWQHKWFFLLAFLFGLLVPACVPGWLWNDWRGGVYFAGFLRLTIVHHCVFSVNSLAHWLGSSTFDDKLTPRDHLLTALVTLGEGYHNFHHQFPMDYRNAVKWYQWDPTKWFIAVCSYLGLASNLRAFPDVEVRRSQLSMQLKRLKQEQDGLPWPVQSDDLPVISWDSYQEQSLERPLLLVSGFIHDVELFMEQHPGGRNMIQKHVGRDGTMAFFGGVYDHSNAAHNLLASMRVGVLHGGLEQAKEAVPPCLKLRIVSWDERKRLCTADR